MSGYSWVEDRRASTSAALPKLRRTAAGQCVLDSSFDSTMMRASAGELEFGWTRYPAGAVSPPLDAAIDIPWEQYDEWWVFPDSTRAAVPRTPKRPVRQSRPFW